MSSAPPAPPASSSPDVLEVSGLELRYSAHGPLVLRGVDLSVGAGERVAVMGPSGSGKSTLLLCAAGFCAPVRGGCCSTEWMWHPPRRGL